LSVERDIVPTMIYVYQESKASNILNLDILNIYRQNR